MAQCKVKKCKYDHGKFKNSLAQNFSVDGNTEGAVKEYLQRRHRNEEIVVKSPFWYSVALIGAVHGIVQARAGAVSRLMRNRL
jgi:hypothetical protein